MKIVLGLIQLASIAVLSGANKCSTTDDDLLNKCTCQGSLLHCSELNRVPDFFSFDSSFKPTQVILNECTLHDLEKSQFQDYHDVTELTILKSSVQSIQEGTFFSMAELKYLNLGSNSLKNITKNTLTGLDKLDYLDLSDNMFDSLPLDFLQFQSPPNLHVLNLGYNKGLKLPDSFLQGSKVKNLTLDHLQLQNIPTKILAHGSELESIDLNHNKIPSIPEEAFSGFANLERLSLDSNIITVIHDNAFKGLPKLRSLNLGYNQLTEFSKKILEPVGETLEEIYLESNRLETLEVDAIRHDKIHTVHLGHNTWVCDCKLRWMKELDLIHKDPENVTCVKPEKYAGHSISNVTEEMLCSWCNGCGKSTVALGVGIPVLLICTCLICYYLYRIMQNRKQRAQIRKGYKYSNVYKDTVEPVGPKAPVSQIA